MKRRIVFIGIMCMLAAVLTVTACSGGKTAQKKEAKPIYIGQTWVISALDPTDSSVPWSMTSHGISETVYQLDKNGKLTSRFIDKMERQDDLTWKATLKEGAAFSDGSAVTAKDLAACLNQIQEKNEFSNATAGKIAFTTDGDKGLTIKTTRATSVMESVLCEWSNVVFKQKDGAFIYTGPYMVKKLDPGVELSLEPNPSYPNADKRSEVIIKGFKDESAMKLAFEGGELDMAFTLTPDVAAMLEKEKKTVKTIEAGYQYFGIVNLDSPILKDLKVREAVNAGLNREDYVKALKGGRVATGTFAGYYSFAGKTQLKCDLDAAKKLLDEAGWKPGSDGIREKDGQKLEIKCVTYPSRPDLTTIMQIAVSQLKELGINAKTEIVEKIDVVGKEGNFDIIFYAQHSAPTGEPSFFLNQFFRGGEGKNMSRYTSEEMNAILDKMPLAKDQKEVDALAVEAQALVYKDLPVLYLVDPQWHIGVSERLKNYQPYCGDYYIVNADLGVE